MGYDYRNGKKRIQNILKMEQKVEERETVPKSDKEFKYDNGIKSWITSIFVDIRDSTRLFEEEPDEDVARIIRAFTSEIIAIMSMTSKDREIGIRGDCVYGVFTTKNQKEVADIFDLCIWINTELNMLNKLLVEEEFSEIQAGIGFAIGNAVIVKAGKKGSGINAKVWTGTAVVTSSQLSSIGEKEVDERIVLSELAYNNIINELASENECAIDWFTLHDEGYYYCDLVKSSFNSWIDNDMPE